MFEIDPFCCMFDETFVLQTKTSPFNQLFETQWFDVSNLYSSTALNGYLNYETNK